MEDQTPEEALVQAKAFLEMAAIGDGKKSITIISLITALGKMLEEKEILYKRFNTVRPAARFVINLYDKAQGEMSDKPIHAYAPAHGTWVDLLRIAIKEESTK